MTRRSDLLETMADGVDQERRRALLRLGIGATVAYAAPNLITLSQARASGGSGGSGASGGSGTEGATVEAEADGGSSASSVEAASAPSSTDVI